MKRAILSIALLFSIFSVSRVSGQDSLKNPSNGNLSGMKYYYYPSQNFYYNEVTGDYWYYDKPRYKWITTRSLPTVYVVNDDIDRYEIVYNGKDIWKKNKMHKTKYKVKKDGTVKTKPKY